jgi:hypothetical protein
MKMIVNRQRIAVSALLTAALAGCGSGSAITPSSQANVASNILEFETGTANLFGAATGLNVVTTYRQPSGAYAPGNSGALLSSPTLTLPAAIAVTVTVGTPAAYDACSTVTTGPAPSELKTTAITSTSQVSGSAAVTSFGQSGGVFGLGIEPFNASAQAGCTPSGVSSTGTPYQVAPYPVPLYASSSPTIAAGVDPNAFVPWGGPPAFNLTGSNGVSVVGSKNYPTGTAGLSEGLDVFAGISPVANGVYTLSVSIPANTGTVTQAQTFTLKAPLKVLGNAVAPAFKSDTAGDGGGTFAFVMPTLATEAYVQITDYGPSTDGAVSCNGSSADAPVYYTLETTATGTLTLAPSLGPGATPSICTAALNTAANSATTTSADQVMIQVVAFDYDLYSASYPNSSGNPAPASILAQASDDITISPTICLVGTASCAAAAPNLKVQAAAHAAYRRM